MVTAITLRYIFAGTDDTNPKARAVHVDVVQVELEVTALGHGAG